MGEETALSKSFKEAAARWLQNKLGERAVVKEVTGWDEYVSSGGGCPTCGPDIEIEVSISYIDSNDKLRSYSHWGNFGYLLEEILSV